MLLLDYLTAKVNNPQQEKVNGNGLGKVLQHLLSPDHHHGGSSKVRIGAEYPVPFRGTYPRA